MRPSTPGHYRSAALLALLAVLLTACGTLEYRQIQSEFNQAVQADNSGVPFTDQHANILDQLTPDYIQGLDPRLRPNAWLLRSVSAWRMGSNDVALVSARQGLREPTLAAGSRDQVVLEMIPALVIDSDLNRRWIEAGRTLTGPEYSATYETTGFVQAWRQLSGPASEAVSQATPAEVIAYLHYQRWRLILNWAAVITSVQPNQDFVAAQVRACTGLGVDRDPMFAAQQEVDQIPAHSPLTNLIRAQGWVKPQP
jgi:hypothetical protein